MLHYEPDDFDPCHSELERKPALLREYVRSLESGFGHGVRVTGILEIGSFAKGEAVPTSDMDTRVFVTSDEGYLFNVFPHLPENPNFYERFITENGLKPSIVLDWQSFNNPLVEEISTSLPRPVEFGFADIRYAAYELSHLDEYASPEHSLLFQSNILYDPDGTLERLRFDLRGKIFTPLARYYQAQHLDRLWFRLYEALNPTPDDDFKLQKSGQILWVQMAVRCLRNAVAAKTYLRSGEFRYKKADVLKFYQDCLPDDFGFVKKLYEWKTDPAVREEMVNGFSKDRTPYFKLFRETMPKLEAVVAHVKALNFD